MEKLDFAVGPDGTVSLPFAECADCGHRSFPAQSYGCLSCGSTRLSDVNCPATGRVLSQVEVLRHRTPGLEGLYRVADISVAGCVLRGILAPSSTADLTGRTVRAVPVDGEAAGSLPAIRFVEIEEVG